MGKALVLYRICSCNWWSSSMDIVFSLLLGFYLFFTNFILFTFPEIRNCFIRKDIELHYMPIGKPYKRTLCFSWLYLIKRTPTNSFHRIFQIQWFSSARFSILDFFTPRHATFAQQILFIMLIKLFFQRNKRRKYKRAFGKEYLENREATI